MLILNSRYYPPTIIKDQCKNRVIFSTVDSCGIYCETLVNKFESIQSYVLFVNDEGITNKVVV